jgi:hypothetical protein
MKAGALITDMSGLSSKPAWLDQIVQVTATTNYENSPKSSIFESYFRIDIQDIPPDVFFMVAPCVKGAGQLYLPALKMCNRPESRHERT